MIISNGTSKEEGFLEEENLLLYQRIAELELQLLKANQRVRAAKLMTHSYMMEFADRGLVYIPKIDRA